MCRLIATRVPRCLARRAAAMTMALAVTAMTAPTAAAKGPRRDRGIGSSTVMETYSCGQGSSAGPWHRFLDGHGEPPLLPLPCPQRYSCRPARPGRMFGDVPPVDGPVARNGTAATIRHDAAIVWARCGLQLSIVVPGPGCPMSRPSPTGDAPRDSSPDDGPSCCRSRDYRPRSLAPGTRPRCPTTGE